MSSSNGSSSHGSCSNWSCSHCSGHHGSFSHWQRRCQIPSLVCCKAVVSQAPDLRWRLGLEIAQPGADQLSKVRLIDPELIGLWRQAESDGELDNAARFAKAIRGDLQQRFCLPHSLMLLLLLLLLLCLLLCCICCCSPACLLACLISELLRESSGDQRAVSRH